MLYDLRELKSVEEARKIKPSDVGFVDQFRLIHLFNLFEALWQYPGEPRKEIAHATTRDKKCTNGFVNCGVILAETNLCEILGREIAKLFFLLLGGRIDWVVDAAYSGVDLGHEIARAISEIQDYSVRHGIVEKDKQGNPTIWGRHVVGAGERVLVVNELMTTARGSTFMAKQAVATENKVQPVEFVPYTFLLVNRSDKDDNLSDGTPVACLARFQMQTYKLGPATCPYCRAGSPRLKPKLGENWKKYFAPYSAWKRG